MSTMLELFNMQWHEVPTVWIDTETTGLVAGKDRAVQVAFARFEKGEFVGAVEFLVAPGIPIPAEATAIHKITDKHVAKAKPIEMIFARTNVQRMLKGAQPAAYNAPFDHNFVPPFGDWTWPWLDGLVVVRAIDRYARGKGRHKLEAACERHGVKLERAHSAGDDARAAGELFYKTVPKLHVDRDELTLGELLAWQRKQAADDWYRYHLWLSQQPPKEET